MIYKIILSMIFILKFFFVIILPLKLKFQSALECVGVVLELRPMKLSSILNTDKSVEINSIALSRKLRPTEVKTFWRDFRPLGIF